MDRNRIINKVIASFRQFDKKFEFEQLKITTDHDITNIYLLNGCALQIEILWREYDLFLYLVNIVEKEIPDNGIYNYDNGQWCRKYIEDIYKIKNPIYKSKKELRYTETFLDLKIEFYKQILFEKPEILINAIKSISE